MPYIDKQRRPLISKPQPFHPINTPRSAGELAYLLSEIVEAYRQSKSERFDMVADVYAALEATRDEFQERVARPLEAAKAAQNGEVFATRKPGAPPRAARMEGREPS